MGKMKSVGGTVMCEREHKLDAPGVRDLVIEVKAVGLNPIDYKLRNRPWAEGEGGRLLGFDVAGEVIGVGDGVKGFSIGDAVFYAGAFNRAGAYAERHLVDYALVAQKPQNLDWEEAAALPLTTLTAWEALHEKLGVGETPGVGAGKTLLVIGGAGGVGSVLIQLARLAGLTVIATASRPESVEWCWLMGAHQTVDHSGDWIGQVRSGGRQWVDYVVNCSDTSAYWEPLAEIICPLGKVCLLVDAAGPVNLNLYKRKSVTLAWEFMGARTVWPDADMHRHGEILEKVRLLVEAGKITSTLGVRLGRASVEVFEAGHRLLQSGKAIGKAVVSF